MQEIKRVNQKVKQEWLDAINQVFEIEKKTNLIKEENSLYRNINKLKMIFEDGFFSGCGFSYHNPLGEDYTDTRTDCEATISGTGVENLEIVEVIKPIIYYSYLDSDKVMKAIVQPAVVIVQSKNS